MTDIITARLLSPALDPERIQLRRLTGTESISQLYRFEIALVSTRPGGLDTAALLRAPATLVIERNGAAVRRVHGMVAALRDRLITETGHEEYIVELVPRAWMSTLTRKHDVFQDVRIPDLLVDKLHHGAGLEPERDVKAVVEATYLERELVVQYDESDLHFVQRWAEHLGMFYFFEQRQDRERLIFGDQNDCFPDLPHTPFATNKARGGVYQLEAARQLVATRFRARDYNYRNPSLEVAGSATLEDANGGVSDEYGAHLKNPEEANRLAEVRAQEAATRARFFTGESDEPRFSAGHRVLIEGHARGDHRLLLTQVVHHLEQPVLAMGQSGDHRYHNTIVAVAAEQTYRPPRVTPRPVVSGTITGVVQTTSPTEFGAIDAEGRYRVSFMYDSVSDREPGKASRPLRMAQPSGGPDRGLHMPLKAGTEVLVTCVNGDPDRPVIAGAVSNPQTQTPVTAANAEKTVIKTNVNQLAIDDREPRAKLTVDGDKHVLQLGSPNFPELGYVMGSVSNASTLVNGVQTAVSDVKTSWQKYKTAAAAKNIVDIAGMGTPWSAWQKIEAVIQGTVGFLKTASGVAGAVYDEHIRSAKDKQAKAEAAFKEERKVIVAELATAHALEGASRKARAILRGEDGPDAPNPYRYPEGAQQKTNSDGTTRLETEDEHGDRKLAELVKSGGPVAESATSRLQAKFDANARASEAAKAAEKQWDESWLNVKKGTDADIIQGVEAVLAMGGTKSPLYSTVSKFFSKATDETNGLVASVLQAAAQLTADMSTGRERAKVGTFGSPHNIQAATNSTGIFGLKNVLVAGREHATVFSEKDTTIAADQRAHVKGTTGVELASPKEILFSTDGKVDALARTRMSLVANTGERKTPDGVTFFCNSRAGFRLETESADVDVHASENARIHAHKAGFAAFGEKRAYLGSAGFGLVATPDAIALGKLTSAGDLDGAQVARHNALSIADRRAQLAIEDSSLALVPATAELASGATRIRLKRDGDAIVDVKGELRAQGRRVLLG